MRILRYSYRIVSSVFTSLRAAQGAFETGRVAKHASSIGQPESRGECAEALTGVSSHKDGYGLADEQKTTTNAADQSVISWQAAQP